MSTATIPAPLTYAFTVADVRQALEEVVAVDPDHRDPRAEEDLPARYCDESGQPNCLVAKVLVRLGFDVDLLHELDREHPVGDILGAGIMIGDSRNPALKTIEPAAVQLLQYVQDHQDAGERWGSIVEQTFRRGSGLTARLRAFIAPWQRAA